MKDRLYYVLYVIYIAASVLVLYMNGVFTGNVTDVTNLAINGVFLVLIGCLFTVSIISFGRLRRCTGELDRLSDWLLQEYKAAGKKSIWNALQERRDLFQDAFLRSAYSRYRARMKSFQTNRGYISQCDLEEYINDDLINRAGMNFFNSAMPGTLTGLGILGTFLGLSIGLGSVRGDDIYAVTDNVGTLLGGMKVAFHTSVYGIFFSLVFGFLYRGIMTGAYDKLENFLNIYRLCAIPPRVAEDADTAAMLVYQANIAGYLKELVAMGRAQSREQIAGLEKLADRFMEQLGSSMNVNLGQLGNSLQNTAEGQRAFAQECRNMLDGIKILAENQRSQQEIIAGLAKRQEELAAQLERQRGQLEDTCQEIGSQLHTFEQMRNYV